MTATRFASIAALVGGIGWTGKILIMWGQGGPDTNSIPEAVAFFAGLLGVVAASGALGWILAGKDTVSRLRIGALVVGAIVPLLVVGAFQTALGAALPDAGWLRDEVVFLLLGVGALLFGGRTTLRPAS